MKKLILSAIGALVLFFVPRVSANEFNEVTRSFNSSFMSGISLYNHAHGTYIIRIACAVSVTGSQTGTVYLDASPDGTTWTEMGHVTNTFAATLGLTLGATITQDCCLSSEVPTGPTGWYYRLRTSGTATISYIHGMEAGTN